MFGRDRACGKSLENYKDRLERREAWEQIFSILDEKYDEMTAEERRLMGETVIYKWTNIRDTFMKSLKTKLGKNKRKYMFHDQLKFLKKNLPKGKYEKEDAGESAYMKQDAESIKVKKVPITKKKSKQNNKDDYVPKSKHGLRKRSKNKRHDDDEEVFEPKSTEYSKKDINFGGVGVDCKDHSIDGESRLMNEDEAFFASLLPTVVRYGVDDKLEFRLGVLEIMKRIKDEGRRGEGSNKWAINNG